MKYRSGTTVSCLLLSLSLLLLLTTQAEPNQEQEGKNSNNPSKWKKLQLPSSQLAAYWVTIKNKYLAAAPLSFLSHQKPSTDFRVKSGEEEEEERGIGEKVKGAVGKSMEKTKETIEESAKSAANMATDKIKKTKEGQDEL